MRLEVGYVRILGGAALAAGAGPPGTGNCSPTMCCHAGTRSSEDHTSTPIAATIAVAAPRNTAGSAADTPRTDTTSPTRTETPAPTRWVRDTRSSPILADRIRKDVPADGGVRTGLGVGEGRQGEKTRRSGDACDSLYLWGTDAGDLARRTSDWDMGWTRKAWNIRGVLGEDNWDLAWAPTAAHAPRRWPVGPVAYTWTARRVAVAERCYFVNVDKPYGRARRLAPGTRRA